MYSVASETPHPYGAPARHSLVSELQVRQIERLTDLKMAHCIY